MIKQLLKLVGTGHQLTLAYSKEENAIVERANKEVMRHFRAVLLDKNTTNDWVTYLPFVQRIMNASENSSIGMSPAQLLFGNAVNLDKVSFCLIRVDIIMHAKGTSRYQNGRVWWYLNKLNE